MDDQYELFPKGLTRQQFDQLSENADRAERYLVDELVGMAMRHVERARQVQAENVLVNAPLAQAIGDCLQRLSDDWGSLPTNSHSWLRAAMDCSDRITDCLYATRFIARKVGTHFKSVPSLVF